MEKKEVENQYCEELEKEESHTCEVWTTSIWTDNMLNALKQGVKGGKWHSLIDKVYSLNNLMKSFQQVKGNKGGAGIDKVSIKQYEEHLESNLTKVSKELKEGRYIPKAVKRVVIPKPGSKEGRPLGIPTVEDRTVQMSTYNVIAPIFEKEFLDCSYGFRPNRGCKDALREVQELLNAGYLYIVDADIKSYFDNIPHERLMERIKEHIADRPLLKLIKSYLKQHIMDEMKEWEPEKGTPQGAVLSPLLSNIYLNNFDRQMTDKGYKIVRYADDWIAICKTVEEARNALAEAAEWMERNQLKLHPTKTRIVDMNIEGEYFEFLGYKFKRHTSKKPGKSNIKRFPRDKSLKKFRDKIRINTRRCNANSLKTIIDKINPSIRGWYAYFKHCYWTTFESLDGWIRMRLRSILRKRTKRKGRGRGLDHKRWRNSFFEENGLFSLAARHEYEVSVLRQGNH